MQISSLSSQRNERIGFVLLFALLIGLAWSIHLTASGANVESDVATLPNAVESPTPCCTDKPHLLIGTYYSVKNGLTAKLLLNNKGPSDLTASPALFSMSGQRWDAPPVTIPGESFRMIDMSQWINIAGLEFEEGSVEVFHLGKDLVLGAQIYLVDAPHSLSFDEKLVEAKSFKSSRLEGLWWLPSPKGQVLLALSNNSDASVSATVNVSGQTPERTGEETVTLGAHQTQLVDVQSDVIHHANGAMSRFGGITVDYAGAPGALYARAMAQDLSIGYSLAVQFSDPSAAKSSQLQGVGLRLGFAGGEALNPVAVVRNVGSATTTVTGRLSYTDQTGVTVVVPVPNFQLDIGEMTTLDLEKILRQQGEGHPNAVGGLEMEYSTPKGTVIASAFSVGDGGNQLFRVPIWDIYALRSSTGGYPWQIDEASSTMVYIKNGENHSQHYFIQVKYDGGIYSIGSKTIDAGQTVSYDLRKLRDEQVPDAQGRVIPLTATSGQVHWSKVGAEQGVLVGRSEQADIGGGMSSNYACANCCNDNPDSSDFKVLPNPTSASVGDSRAFTASVYMIGCYSNSYYINVDDAVWSSSNAEVATIGAGLALAQSAGTTNIGAQWHTSRYRPSPPSGSGFEPIGGSGECEEFQVTLTATAATLTVKPLPDHLITFNDQQGYTTQTLTGTCGTQYFIRQVGFQIVSSDSTGAVNIGNTDIKENYDTVTTNTCGNGQPVPDSTCTLTAAGVGRFIETMSTGCGAANGPANCGYSIDWTWFWCGDSNHGQTALAALNGRVDRDAVLFCHRIDAWPAGSPFYPVFGPP